MLNFILVGFHKDISTPVLFIVSTSSAMLIFGIVVVFPFESAVYMDSEALIRSWRAKRVAGSNNSQLEIAVLKSLRPLKINCSNFLYLNKQTTFRTLGFIFWFTFKLILYTRR